MQNSAKACGNITAALDFFMTWWGNTYLVDILTFFFLFFLDVLFLFQFMFDTFPSFFSWGFFFLNASSCWRFKKEKKLRIHTEVTSFYTVKWTLSDFLAKFHWTKQLNPNCIVTIWFSISSQHFLFPTPSTWSVFPRLCPSRHRQMMREKFLNSQR